MVDLENINIKKAHQDLIDKKYSVRELVDAYLKNIENKNNELNIYLSIFSDSINEEVDEAQKKIDNGEATILTGIPIGIKANINIKGKNTNCASKILENYISPYNATVIEKLKKEFVIFLGYLNMDEFACGSSTENSAFGVTKNPLDISRVSGGSSGGSAAAIVANMAMVSLGTDTGGSVRQPASFCGVVGMKPTYGRVSRFGAAAMGSSLDQISPISKNIEDNKIVLDIISGEDGKDMNVLSKNNFLNTEINLKKKIAISSKLLDSINNKKIIENFYYSLEKFKKKGYEIIDLDLDIFKYALPVYYVIMSSELSTNLSRLDGMRYGNKISGEELNDDYLKTRGNGFGEEIKRRIILGTYCLSNGYEDEYYNKSGVLRIKIKSEFSKIMGQVDAILMPTTPTVAFKIGENKNPIDMYLSDILTITPNIIGNPAISIPNGFMKIDDKEMPTGLQIIGDFKQEGVIYKMAGDLED